MYKTATILCKASIYTRLSTGEVVRTAGVHSGPPDPSAVEVARLTTKIKRRCEESNETPSALVDSVLSTATTATLGRLLPPPTISRLINRHRNAFSGAPSNPACRASIVLSEQYRMYESEPGTFENFLVADTGVGDEYRIMIFGRESTKSRIGHVDKLYVDGTFNLAPPLFAQVSVILAERSRCVTPVAYALLPDKTGETYTRMLRLVKEAWPALNPSSVVMDYERAMVNAIREFFPMDVSIHGCFFHLVKNVKLRVAREGLWSRYTSDDSFSLKARMIAALAFVVPTEIDNAVSELAPVLPAELIPVLNYFEDVYIGRLNGVRPDGTLIRRAPQFPIEMWSV
ncbi:uncharacterized protein LOC108864006 [Galendromus occidentalis]|uniref:Uncharacterized protein LOC108864006 n=1 Tax=Galendromus occidentalis TaxID=34638 RepID=A0AAJ7P9C9_9ACAR|nr:uncharacterized protein LOC108864006 [Galendromus occidentalis]